MRKYLLLFILLFTTNTFGSQLTLDNQEVASDLKVDTNTLFVDASEDKVGINTASPSDALHVIGDVVIEATAASGVTISNAPLKVGDSLQIGNKSTYSAFYQDEGDIYSNDGKIYSGSGINTVAERYGVGLQVRDYKLAKTLSYDIDATFTAATQTIEKIGQTFVTDGVEVDDFLVVTDANDKSYIGSTGEVIGVTETTIVASIAAAGNDAPSDLTDMDIVIYNHPIASILDNGDIHFNVGVSRDASLKILVDDGNNQRGVHIVDVAGVNGHAAMEIEMDSDLYSGTSVVQLDYDISAFDAGEVGTVFDVIIDNNSSAGGHVHVLDVEVTNASNETVEIAAISAGPSVDVIHQEVGTPSSLNQGYIYDSSLTAHTQVTASFTNSAINVTIFDGDNDQILVASMTTFDQINVILNTPSSQSIDAVFEYIEDDGSWVIFVPADGTNNFTQDGTVKFSSEDLSTWGVRTVNEVTGGVGASDLYWMRVTRTRNNIVTQPIESTIGITNIGDTFTWDSSGRASMYTIAVSDGITAPAGVSGFAQIFVDSGDGDLKVIFGDGTVTTIAAD